jgi:hypothetical protein
MKISSIAILIFLAGLTFCRQKESAENSINGEKWFIAKFTPLCDDSRGIFWDINKLKNMECSHMTQSKLSIKIL